MGRESTAWGTLRDQLRDAGVMCRRWTDRFEEGAPDVIWVHKGSGVTGLLETKAIDQYPVRSTTPVRIDFQPAQPAWLYTWARDGGRALLMCRVTKARHWLVWHVPNDPGWVGAIQGDACAVPHLTITDRDRTFDWAAVFASPTQYNDRLITCRTP